MSTGPSNGSDTTTRARPSPASFAFWDRCGQAGAAYRAVALDEEAKVIELRPGGPPDGAGWLACVGGQVVGRASVPLQAVRAAEAALGGD